MVLTKFIQFQSRKLHTFHFKFKEPSSKSFGYLDPLLLNSLSPFENHKKSFNIGQLSCSRMSSNPIVIEPSSTHQATLFFFHGLGDTGSGWSDYWQCLGVSNLKIILPTAPSNRVTLNMGMKMPSWFDIYGLSEDSKEDEEGIKKSAENVHNLIDEEISKTGISSDKILLGGFSQGGALAIYSALTYPKKLAGTVLYSCWLPLHKSISNKIVDVNKQLPTLQCHGNADFVVPCKWGQMTRDFLQNEVKNEHVTWKVYDGMAHSGCTEESKDTKEFLKDLLPKL